MPSVIQVHNLRKTYGSVIAADDISGVQLQTGGLPDAMT